MGPKYTKPTVPMTPLPPELGSDQFKETKNWKRAQPADTTLRGDWWTMFGDPELDALEAQVDVSNQNLKLATARFAEARAAIRFNRAGLFPTLSTGVGITAQRGSANRTVVAPASTSAYGDFYLPVDLSYEVDAWGRLRRSVEAAREEAQATAADLETLKLSLHAELAYDYFELRSADAEQQLLNDTVKAYESALQLTKNRFEGGATSAAEVAEAQTQLDSARTQQTDIGVARAKFEHAIAVLTGQPPAALTLGAKVWSQEPPVIPVALPSQLLERRPDIAAAERRVAEGNAQIGIARAAFFPSLLLSVSGGFEGGGIANWLSWPGRFWAVGPTMLQTVFDGGRRRATSEAARANYDAAVAAYRQTALDAFQQVEDNLAALRLLEQETVTQNDAVASARRSLELATNRYRGGIVTYLEVLTAQNIALANERTAVDVRRRRMDATVLLAKALGGGWSTAQLPKLDR